jgi:hypothetical protein
MSPKSSTYAFQEHMDKMSMGESPFLIDNQRLEIDFSKFDFEYKESVTKSSLTTVKHCVFNNY